MTIIVNWVALDRIFLFLLHWWVLQKLILQAWVSLCKTSPHSFMAQVSQMHKLGLSKGWVGKKTPIKMVNLQICRNIIGTSGIDSRVCSLESDNEYKNLGHLQSLPFVLTLLTILWDVIYVISKYSGIDLLTLLTLFIVLALLIVSLMWWESTNLELFQTSQDNKNDLCGWVTL